MACSAALYQRDGRNARHSIRRRLWIGLIENAHALCQINSSRHRDEAAAQLVGLARDGLQHECAAAHVHFELLRLPLGGTHLHALHAKPATLVEPAKKTEAEIDIVVEMALEA